MNTLPQEIVSIILCNLEKEDIFNCSLVNKTWYRFTNDNKIWKKFCPTEYTIREPNENIKKELDSTLMTPCKWKLIAINHNRISKNWRKNRYKGYEIVGTHCMAECSYDGKTVIVYNKENVDVYNIENSELTHRQTLIKKYLEPIICFTNNKYIIIICLTYLAVYKLEHDDYVLSHYICIDDEVNNLFHTKDHSVARQSMQHVNPTKFSRHTSRLLGNMIYFYFRENEKMFVWDLNEMRCRIIKDGQVKKIIPFGRYIYYCYYDYVLVYDKNGSEVMTLESGDTEYHVQINNDIVLISSEIRNSDSSENTVWSKMKIWKRDTGDFIFVKKFNVKKGVTLHPQKNIILDMKSFETPYIIAYDLFTDQMLWKCEVTSYNLFGSFHIISSQSLFIYSGISSHVYDCNTGKYLYSLDHRVDNQSLSSYDLLIHKTRSNKLIIRLYS